MDLTNPLSVAQLRAAFPRDTRGMEDDELLVLLEVEEHAIRSQYAVIRTDADSADPLRRALIAAWPSFLIQVRQIAQQTAGAANYSVTFNRSAASRRRIRNRASSPSSRKSGPPMSISTNLH